MTNWNLTEVRVTDKASQSDAFESNLHVDLCNYSNESQIRIQLLSNMVVGRQEFALPIITTWKSSKL